MTYQQELELVKKHRKRANEIAKRLENYDTIFFRVRSDWGVLVTHKLIAIGALNEKSHCPIAQGEKPGRPVTNIACYKESLGKFIIDMTSYIRVEKRASMKVVHNN